jgi:hypothetical protein
MKFKNNNTPSCQFIASQFEGISGHDRSALGYTVTLLDELSENDGTGDITFSLKWRYIILFHAKELFTFFATNYYIVTEIETPETDDDLEEIINESFAYLKREFDKKKNEYKAIVLGDIQFGTMSPLVQQLHQALLPLR